MTGAPPSTLEMVSQLLGASSISSTCSDYDQGNLDVINLLASWLEELGFSTQIQPLTPNKANLIATLGKGNPSQSLILSGHTDTVPYDLERWESDPFKMTQKSDRLYGLGSADMKSFFALAISAISQFDKHKLENPITLIATADEESTMRGARALKDLGYIPGRFTIIGEPTNLRPIRMHKGVMMESIRITGQSAHSSNPALGANAIEGMQAVLADLINWRNELQQQYQNPMFEVDVPTLNFGSIHGGNNPNRICGHCESQIDLRPLPGMQLHSLREALSERLHKLMAYHPRLTLEVSPLFPGIPAFEQSPSSQLVVECERISGERAGAVAFGTEAPFYSSLGIETVVMGPGSIDQAHQANEYIEMNQIAPAINKIASLIHHFCQRK